MNFKYIFTVIFWLTCLQVFPQATNQLELNPDRVKMFMPYLAARHGGFEGVEKLKQSDKYTYLREMWYFSESFYIKRNHLNEGVELNEQIIDVTRFEQHRKMDEEAFVIIPGFKDALVLKPLNKLVYKPTFN